LGLELSPASAAVSSITRWVPTERAAQALLAQQVRPAEQARQERQMQPVTALREVRPASMLPVDPRQAAE